MKYRSVRYIQSELRVEEKYYIVLLIVMFFTYDKHRYFPLWRG